MARAKFLSSPAQRAEWMPGAPPSASTASPESSANAGSFAVRGRCPRLDAGIVAEARAGFFRLAKAEFGGGDRLDAVGREQLPHFPQLARIVGRDDDPARELAMRRAHITASFCRSTSLPMPFLASASSVEQLRPR